MVSLKTAVIIGIAAVSLHYFRQYLKGGVCESKDRVDGKVVIVTGANTGIGKETAKELVKRGGRVYMVCRSMEKGQKALDDIKQDLGDIDDRLILMKMDLNSLKSVRQFVKEFKKRETKLDILINNAGVMYIPTITRTEDGFEQTFGVNHLGHFLLTHLLMELLMAASPSRVINVSSLGHTVYSMNWEDINYHKSYSVIGSYSQSKLANVLFTKELAKRLTGTSVTTYSLHPGVVDPELGRHIPFIDSAWMQPLRHAMNWMFFKKPIQGMQTTLCCAVDKSLERETGKYYSDCVEKEPSTDAQNVEDAKRLWDISLEMVKLSPSEVHPKLIGERPSPKKCHI